MHENVDDNDAHTLRLLNNNHGHCIQAIIRGRFTTSPVEDRIATLSSGGMVAFREHDSGSDRAVTIRPAAAGSADALSIQFRLDGADAPFDAAAQRWLAGLLPQILAEASINVEPRVARWRAEGGTDAVLRHVAALRSSSAKRSHYEVLLAQPLLAAELQRVVVQAGKEVASSSDLRAVLSKAAAQSRTGGIAGSALESSIAKVASSTDRTAVLEAFGQTDDRDQLLAVMRVAATIPASTDKANLLSALAPRYLGRNDAALREAFFKTLVTIPASTDRANVLDCRDPLRREVRRRRTRDHRCRHHGPGIDRPRQRAHHPRRARCDPHPCVARCVPARRAADPVVDRHAQHARSAHPPLTPHHRVAVMPSSHPRRTSVSAKNLASVLSWKLLLLAGVCAALPSRTPLAAQTVGGPEADATPPAGAPARALATASRAAPVLASRAERAPVIDGRDDDAAWSASTPIDGFQQFDPVEGAEATMRTEARIAYDAANLYVFVRAYDPHPDSILSLLSRRDVRTASDQIKVMIDSYHDRRTGYEFAVNPAGVKRDYYAYDDGQEDVSWDAVWDVATRIDSVGWTAEFRIPLSQLRYPPAASHTFGVMIIRELMRRNERVSWPLLRRSRNALVSQFGDVGGLAGLGSPRRLEIAPYMLVRNTGAVRGDDIHRSQQGTIGADLKYGLTSNLTLDGTINPDFGQVEADPAQLNLTAFETFFEERRPFFLEGMSIFQFGADPEQLFYSRRIGRDPQLAGLAPDGVDIPGASRILGAAKLTGRVAGGTSLGVLTAVTDQVTAGGTTIEPRTTYGLARATRDLRGGESTIGMMVTAVDRALGVGESPYLRRDAYAAGVDGRHRFGEGRYELSGSVAMSDVRGSAAAIARTQLSSVHEYQRPDDALAVDTTRTSLEGTSVRVIAKKVAGLVRATASYQRTTPGYETNDFGFLARADEQIVNTNLRFIPSGTIGPWRNPSLEFYGQHHFTTAGLPTGALYEAYASGSLKSGAYFSVDSWVDNAGTVYCDRCARGGPALRLSPSYNTLVNFVADPQADRIPTVRGDLHARRRGALAALARASVRGRPSIIAARRRARHSLPVQPRQHAVDRQRRRDRRGHDALPLRSAASGSAQLHRPHGSHDPSDDVAAAVRRAVRHRRPLHRRARDRRAACARLRRALPSLRRLGPRRRLQREELPLQRRRALGVPPGIDAVRRLDAGPRPDRSRRRHLRRLARLPEPLCCAAGECISHQGGVLAGAVICGDAVMRE